MHAVNTSCLPHLEGAYRMDAASRAHHPLALWVASPVLDQVGLCGLWGLQVHQMCVCVVEHGVASEQEEQEETHPSEKSDNQTEHETDAAEGSTTRRRRRYPDMIVPCKHRCKAEKSYKS